VSDNEMATLHLAKNEEVYVLGCTRRGVQSFINKRGLRGAVPIVRIAELPRKANLRVILLNGYVKHPDYAKLFGDNRFFCTYQTTLYYEHEVKTRH
jgi:hypothetical protein